MTVYELSANQLKQLKANHLNQHLTEVEGRFASYNELANADEIIPDEMIFQDYASTDFSSDDFFQ